MSMMSVNLAAVLVLVYPFYAYAFILIFFSYFTSATRLKLVFGVDASRLIAIAVLPAFLLPLFARAYTSTLALSQVYMSPTTAKAHTASAAALLIVLLSTASTTKVLPASPIFTFLPAAALLLFFFTISASLTSVFSMVLLIEIVGILLLLLFLLLPELYRDSSFNSSALAAGKFRQQGSFVGSFLVFIWVSAVSMLFIIWGLYGLTACGFSLDLRSPSLISSSPYAWLVAFGLILKLGAIPAQTWLFSLYSTLPVVSVFIYFQTYYLFFLVLVMKLLFIILPMLTLNFAAVLALCSFFSLLNLFALSSRANEIQPLLALSSAVNMTIMLILAS